MAFHVLLVDPDPSFREFLARLLSTAGYTVHAATSFDETREQMSREAPDLLITAIRLDAFNGLHLVLRYRPLHPEMPIVVIADQRDAMLKSEAIQHGAEFVSKPIDRDSFLALLGRLLADRAPRAERQKRRWTRKQAELPAAVSHTMVRIVDLSYGGLRLELDEIPRGFESPFEVDLPTAGISLQVVPRWTRPAPSSNVWWCGAEIAPADSYSWRSFVDSL